MVSRGRKCEGYKAPEIQVGISCKLAGPPWMAHRVFKVTSTHLTSQPALFPVFSTLTTHPLPAMFQSPQGSLFYLSVFVHVGLYVVTKEQAPVMNLRAHLSGAWFYCFGFWQLDFLFCLSVAWNSPSRFAGRPAGRQASGILLPLPFQS